MNSQKLSPAKKTSNVTGRGSDRQKATRFMFERYLDILDAVRSGSYPNTSQLASLLEVSMSTVSPARCTRFPVCAMMSEAGRL